MCSHDMQMFHLPFEGVLMHWDSGFLFGQSHVDSSPGLGLTGPRALQLKIQERIGSNCQTWEQVFIPIHS